jgi:hypothetical protein
MRSNIKVVDFKICYIKVYNKTHIKNYSRNLKLIDARQARICNIYKNTKLKLLKTIVVIWFSKMCKIKQFKPNYIHFPSGVIFIVDFCITQILMSMTFIFECISWLIKVTGNNDARWKLEINIFENSTYVANQQIHSYNICFIIYSRTSIHRSRIGRFPAFTVFYFWSRNKSHINNVIYSCIYRSANDRFPALIVCKLRSLRSISRINCQKKMDREIQ